MRKLLSLKIIFFLILFFGIFGLAKSSRAADYFIAQNQSGNNSGDSCANAKSISWVSDANNWYDIYRPDGTIRGPGDTIHLCGTISSELFIWNGGDSQSGPGHGVLTVLFEPGAKMSAPVFPDAIYIANFLSYITIDGRATGLIGGPNGNPALANGVIENTANGTGLQYSQSSSGIYALETSFLTVKNLVVRNIYVRTSTDDSINGTYSGGGGIADVASNGSFHDLVITNNIVHDMQQGIGYDFGNNYNVEISHNTIYNVNWGVGCGSRNAEASMSGFYFHDNYIHDMANWDDTTGQNAFHHNGMFCFVYNGGSLNDVYVYNNTVGPGFGVTNSTGMWLDTTGPGGGSISNGNFFNNLLIVAPGEHGVNNALLQGTSDTNTDFRFLNNTFKFGEGSQAIASSVGDGGTITVQNNLGYGSGSGLIFETKCGQGGITANHNLFYNFASIYPYACISPPYNNGTFYTLSEWQSLTGQDLDIMTADPLLNSDYRLQAGSPAIGAGANLGSMGITQLNFDRSGRPRPASAAWDIGAFEYQSGDIVAPSAPSSLSVN